MKKTIAVDFDGTLCASNWPKIGEPNRELISQLAEEFGLSDTQINRIITRDGMIIFGILAEDEKKE